LREITEKGQEKKHDLVEKEGKESAKRGKKAAHYPLKKKTL